MCIVYAFLPVVLGKKLFSLSLSLLSLNHLSFHYSLILIDHAFDLVSLLQLDPMVDLPVVDLPVVIACYCDHHHYRTCCQNHCCHLEVLSVDHDD